MGPYFDLKNLLPLVNGGSPFGTSSQDHQLTVQSRWETLSLVPTVTCMERRWQGGPNRLGTVYKLDPKTHQVTIVYSFTSANSSPEAGLVQGNDW